MINKIKNAIRKCRSEFEKAEMWKRFLFIALSLIALIVVFWIIRFLWGILPIILIPLFVVGIDKLEKWSIEQVQKPAPVYQPQLDGDTICDCMQEAICAAATMLEMQQPISARSIIFAGHPSSDGLPRWWFRTKKKDAQFGSYDVLNVRDVLMDELEQAFVVNRNRFSPGTDGLFLDVCNDRGYYYELAVIPLNKRTAPYISQKLEDTKEKEEVFQVPEVTFSCSGTATPFLRKDPWIKYRKRLGIEVDLDKTPHIGIWGATGSGKSWLIKALVAYFLLKYDNPECTLSVADWKGQDYDFLKGCRGYYNHAHYGEALIKFKNILEARIAGKNVSLNRHLLVLDEWNNFLTSLTVSEKNQYLDDLSYCLNLGRSYNMNVVIGSQAAHAEFFGKSRDSISCVVGLGQISKVTAQMLFTPYTDEPIEPQPRGCGYLLLDGQPLQKIIVPYTDNTAPIENIMRDRCS